MIPDFNASGVLPPFVGESPGQAAAMMSPYKSSVLEVVERFGTSAARRTILRGFLRYRGALRAIGLDDGFQWIDGSFVEDIESAPKPRAPRDIDIVTFFRRPAAIQDREAWVRFFQANDVLLGRDRRHVKETYLCDAFLVDLGISPDLIVDHTRYWFGLFSHQRATALWKGMVQIPLADDDAAAAECLANLGEDDEEA